MKTVGIVAVCLAMAIVLPANAVGVLAEESHASATPFETSDSSETLKFEDPDIANTGNANNQGKEDGAELPSPLGHVKSVPSTWASSPFTTKWPVSQVQTERGLVIASDYGTYAFRRDTADLSVLTSDGNTRVSSSYFTIESGGSLLDRGSAQLSTTGDSASMEYEVLKGKESWGHLMVSVKFNPTHPPKISAIANLGEEASRIDEGYRVMWVVATPHEGIFQGPGSPASEHQGTGHQFEDSTNAWAGDLGGMGRWTRRVVMDWSGEKATTRTIKLPSGENALLVGFAPRKNLIDPFIVVEDMGDGTVAASTQRKTFSAAGRVWAFYWKKVDIYGRGDILFRSGRLVHDSPAYMEWEEESVVVDTDDVEPGFDIAVSGTTVALAWTARHFEDPFGPRYETLHTRVGSVSGNMIAWLDGRVLYTGTTDQFLMTPSVSIGMAGKVWVATSIIDYYGTDTYSLEVFLVADQGAGIIERYSWPLYRQAYPVLLPMFEDRVLMVYCMAESWWIYWRLWDPHRSYESEWTGLGYYGVFGSGIDCGEGANSFSAVGTDRISPEYTAYGHVLYIGETGEAMYARIRVMQSEDPGIVDASATLSPGDTDVEFPTISADGNGDLHALWTRRFGYPALSHIYYRRSAPGSLWQPSPLWKSTYELFEPLGTAIRKFLSASYKSMENLYIVWQEETSPTTWDVKLGFLPLPESSANVAPDPWSRPGLSQDSPFISNGDEYVAIGTGRLVVRKMDILVPGRGLDLEITRYYVQPAVLDGYAPYGYDDYPWAPIGTGWRLNLPWITDTFVHWKDGQKYLINWEEKSSGKWTFENHQGTHFSLDARDELGVHYYVLTESSGVQYRFHESGRLESITDSFGNAIQMNYVNNKISTIVDSIGRVYAFTYHPVLGCLSSITYAGGKTVSYSYIGGVLGCALTSATDQEGRVESYGYAWGISQYLLDEIFYVTGGHTKYDYETYLVGSDSWSQAVMTQTIYDSADYSSMARRIGFDYEMVWGKAVFVNVTARNEANQLQGYTHYVFDSQTGGVVTRIYDTGGLEVEGTLLRKTRNWYSFAGSIASTETFLGSANLPSYYSNTTYDNWGNVIYTRDPSGHERFASYLNTWQQNVFLAPGRLERTASGLYFRDDFSDRNLKGWTISSLGSLTIDKSNFPVIPPSVRMESEEYPSWVYMMNSIAPMCSLQSGFAEFRVSFGESADYHDIVLGGNLGERIAIRFGAGGEIKYLSSTSPPQYSSFSPALGYMPGWWYRIGVWFYRVSGELKWDFWINGLEHQTGIGTVNSWLDPCGIDAVGLYAGVPLGESGVRHMWIKEVKAYKHREVKISGLQYLNGVRLRSAEGAVIGQARVPYGSTSVWVEAKPLFPEVRIEILGIDLALETQSTFVEVWGGDEYVYTSAWSLGSLARTRNGFTYGLGYPRVLYLDESLPPGSEQGGNEAPPWPWWDESNDDLPIPATSSKIHLGKYNEHFGDHWYYGGIALAPLSYLLQYAYIPVGQSPDELMLEYCTWPLESPYECDWVHRAYWGENFIPRGEKHYMGDIPERREQWLMLVIRTDDIIDCGDPNHCDIRGIAYDHHGGNVSWDYSASRPNDEFGNGGPGIIKVNGPSVAKVELLDEDGVLIAESNPFTPTTLDLYAAGVTAFPIRGQFKVYSAGPTLEYVSPMFDNLWGGDVFEYDSLGFYTNAGMVGGQIRDKLAGTLEFQTGRGAPSEVRQLQMFKYFADGFQVETKSSHKDGALLRWITASQLPDSYGNVASVTDPGLHQTVYQYTCNNAYVWKETRGAGGSNIVTEYGYDCATGLTTSVKNPRGYTTDYSYDELGRLLSVTYPPVLGVRDIITFQYSDVSRTVTYTDEEGDRTQRVYDFLARHVMVRRLSDSGATYSEATRSYNWQGLVAGTISPEGVTTSYLYDLLGRVRKVINDDATYVEIVYEDRFDGQTQTVYEEFRDTEPRDRKDYVYDLSGNLVMVLEYYDDMNHYTTEYTYDEVGNLLSSKDAKSPPETTTHTYDDLDRLTRTDYPAGSPLLITYDDEGKVVQTNRGVVTSFVYDDIHRIETSDADFGSLVREYAYDPNSNLIGATSFGLYLGGIVGYQYDERDRVIVQSIAVPLDVDSLPSPICGNVMGEPVPLHFFNFGWTKDRTLQHVTYPDGFDVSYTYDAFDRPLSVSTVTNSIEYNRDDQITEIDFVPGLTTWSTVFDYDSMGRLDWIDHKRDGSSYLLLDYGYYADSNIETINNDGTLETYTYDRLDRLTGATGAWGTLGFTYDSVGNRLTKTNTGIQTTYFYDGANAGYNWLDRYTVGGQTTSFVPDGHRNIILKTSPGGTWEYNYDSIDQLISVENPPSTVVQCHGYDADGRRVRIEQPLTGIRLIDLWVGSKLMAEQDFVTGNYIDYIYLGGRLLARYSQTTRQHWYYMQDHLGSTRLVVQKSTGAIVFSANYEPFGVEIAGTGQENIKYIQRQWDQSIGLSYLLQRYYDPGIGRFYSLDPVLGSPSDPQTLNRYTYTANDPMNRKDPNGDFFWFIFIGVVLVSAAINTGVYATTCGGSCSLAGYAGAFLGGAAAGAIGYLAAGAGLGMAMLGGAAANMAAYTIQGVATGTFTWEGLGIAGITGAGMGALGWGVGKLGARLSSPAKASATTTKPGNEIIPRGTGWTLREVGPGGKQLYRIWGGESLEMGGWWGTVRTWTREACEALYGSLSPGNTAKYLSIGWMEEGTLYWGRTAASGAEEIWTWGADRFIKIIGWTPI